MERYSRVPRSHRSLSPQARLLAQSITKRLNLCLVVVDAGLGFLTWAVFLYLGRRLRRRSWLVWSAGYAALTITFWVVEVTGLSGPSHRAPVIAPILFLLTWIGGIAHYFVIRRDVARRMARLSELNPAIIAARDRIDRRAEGRRLAVTNPVRAREAGVGRPDLPGADDFGLVDVNHAPAAILSRLPGVTPEIAALIEQTRDRVGSFASADDLCVTLDLPPALTRDLKEHSIFL
jgi:hypothetical protein